MSGFRLGFQTHVHGLAPAEQLLPGIIDLFVAAEELGFESGWIAQHHLGNDAGRLPSPLVLLGAVAERTSTIRLGATVVVLPLENPVRLAEDAGVLDAIAGGRLELGLGTGGPSEPEFAAFGRDPATRKDLYREHLARLLEVLGEPLAEGLRLNPESSGIRNRIWESPSSPERVAEVAAADHGLLLGVGKAQQQRDLADAYLRARADAGLTGPARIGAYRGGFPGADRESQAALLWPDVSGFLDAPGAREYFPVDPEPQELLAALTVHYGSVDDVIASALADPTLPVASDFVFAVQAASTSIADALRTLEILATDVAPELGWTAPATARRVPA